MIQHLSNKPELRVIGIMSGTSLDGIDIADVLIRGKENDLQFELINYECYPIPESLHLEIKKGFSANAAELCKLQFRLGDLFAEAVRLYLKDYSVSAKEIDLIGSHGQTIYHIHRQCSLQLGEADTISLRTGIPVVYDFRAADIAAGGSGAPLVPFFDRLICSSLEENTVLQNLGGIGNLTFIPGEKADDLQAFDTGPVNVLLNEIVDIFTDGEHSFDKDGMFSKQGQINRELLGTMLEHPFLGMLPPKSTGREDFGFEYVKSLMQQYPVIAFEDFLRTAVQFVAETLIQSYQSLPDFKHLVISGGGAHHPLLMELLQNRVQAKVQKFSEFSDVHEDAKEALAFAILGYAKMKGIPSNIPEITGAGKPVSLGKLSWHETL